MYIFYISGFFVINLVQVEYRSPTWRAPTKMRSIKRNSFDLASLKVWRHTTRTRTHTVEREREITIERCFCSFWKSHVSIHFQGMAFLWPLLAWFWHRVVEQDVGCRTWTKQKCQIHKRPSRESSLASINVPQISSVLPSRECMIFRKMKNDSIWNATQKWKRRHKKKWTSIITWI